ncbi:HAD domain-containing protein [Paenarthrobacter sp. NPDC089675]|uniref:HAD domain-containing protein n=1 Tax=Paenarthrobacter TaxID=1742992 RepID=UPI0038087EB6
MKPVILLDVDGVLNPVVHPGRGGEQPTLRLSNQKKALVLRLARIGRIAWISTWPADAVAGLEGQLGLGVEALRVVMIFRRADADVPTPKLSSLKRWLSRMEALEEADWDCVVWIDDVLGPDARAWAEGYKHPVHLVQPHPGPGLTEDQVRGIEAFVTEGES